MPDLDRYLLKEIVLVQGNNRISPDYFKDQPFMLGQPAFKNLFLIFFCHASFILSISTVKMMTSYKKEKNSI